MKSISGNYLILNGNLIIWSSKKQSVVARSSDEAEFHRVANVVCQVMSLLTEMGLQMRFVPVICTDSASVGALTVTQK